MLQASASDAGAQLAGERGGSSFSPTLTGMPGLHLRCVRQADVIDMRWRRPGMFPEGLYVLK